MTEQDDFDWVKACVECNAKAVFGQLRKELETDVRRIEKRAKIRALLEEPEYGNHNKWIVRRGSDRHEFSAIVFEFDESTLRITQPNPDETVTEIMTLNVEVDGDGKCVMVDQYGHPLKSWQVRRLALGDIFFPELEHTRDASEVRLDPETGRPENLITDHPGD